LSSRSINYCVLFFIFIILYYNIIKGQVAGCFNGGNELSVFI
jgi:hypothetical protein